MPLARRVGVGLFVLGIACLPSKAAESHRSALLGSFVFNAGGLTILFVWVGVATTLHGFLLWPTVILRAIIAAALLPHLVTKGSVLRLQKTTGSFRNLAVGHTMGVSNWFSNWKGNQ